MPTEAVLTGIEALPFRHLADAFAYLRGEFEPDEIAAACRGTVLHWNWPLKSGISAS
jgi:hypothetical protein